MKYLNSSVAAAAIGSLAMRPAQYARMDATTGEDDVSKKLDKLLAGVGTISTRLDEVQTRLDSVEKENKEMKADAQKRADAEKKEGEEKRYDAMCVGRYSKRKDDDDDASYKARHDAEEGKEREEREKRGEAKEVAADKARKHRKDAEEHEEKERKDAQAKADAARADAETRDLIAGLAKRIPMDASHEDFQKLLAAQAKADDVFRLFGDSAPRPLNGENLLAYRCRVAEKLKTNSAAWKSVDLTKLAKADADAFTTAETQIYADSAEMARTPTAVADGELRMVRKPSASGHTITEFVGRPSAWMGRFAPTPRFVTAINQPKPN